MLAPILSLSSTGLTPPSPPLSPPSSRSSIASSPWLSSEARLRNSSRAVVAVVPLSFFPFFSRFERDGKRERVNAIGESWWSASCQDSSLFPSPYLSSHSSLSTALSSPPRPPSPSPASPTVIAIPLLLFVGFRLSGASLIRTSREYLFFFSFPADCAVGRCPPTPNRNAFSPAPR
ncbi:hypothetical protein GGS23DRAFT_553982 [Durotheca rogersii]|uniref:uncharacterized protein n=1 Tax=Durotheca rogersii TaxID=419775 RepID=UPI00221FF5E3|nr:uncharacterized protein GGS23DRAFT_553982 [Durotheca rogersii]KAI5865732.1 hypothetical protein GGS23DRAFT_553982 [Durotheca rogersii]